MKEQSSDDEIQLSLSISTDRDHFLRRTCPSCGRDFKTEIDEADLVWAVAPQFRRMGVEIGAKPGESKNTSQELLHCPYCQHYSEPSEMLTEETVNYIQRLITREVVLPMTKGLFSDLEMSSRKPAGLFSVRIEHSRSLSPPRPIHGPETTDMKIVHFLCCGKKAKISEGWFDVTVCVFCGSPVALM